MDEEAKKEEKEEETPEGAVVCPSSCSLQAWLQYWFSFNIYWRTLAWFGLVSMYLLLGGLIFTLAERSNEVDTVEKAQEERESAIQTIIDLLVNVSNGTINETQAGVITAKLVEFSSRLQELDIETNPLWEYGSSVFFATTVITTIGYGNTAPVTTAGQVLFVIYALIGIPIALIFLTMLGEILAGYIILIVFRFGRYKSNGLRLLLVIIVLTLGLVLFILIPARIFNAIESWDYGESVYFCFVTLTTVGFGDFVPAVGGGSMNTNLLGFYRICTSAWIWVGLAFVAMLITLIQKMLKHTGERCGERCTCDHCWPRKVDAKELEETPPDKTPPEETPQEKPERQERSRESVSPVTPQGEDPLLPTAVV